MKTEAILTQTVEQLERINEALAALRRELLPGQPKKFAILAEGPLEDIRRLQAEIEQLTTSLATAHRSGVTPECKLVKGVFHRAANFSLAFASLAALFC